MTRPKLNPCPFCGGEAVYHRHHVGIVYCTTCAAETAGVVDSRDDAAYCWNRRASGWISVEERLPEDETKPVLVCYGGGLVDAGRLSVFRTATHWAPYPEPPTEP